MKKLFPWWVLLSLALNPAIGLPTQAPSPQEKEKAKPSEAGREKQPEKQPRQLLRGQRDEKEKGGREARSDREKSRSKEDRQQSKESSKKPKP